MRLRVLFVTGRLGAWHHGGIGQVEYNLVRELSKRKDIALSLMGTIPPRIGNPHSFYPSNITLIPFRTTRKPNTLGDIIFSNILYPLNTRNEYHIVHLNVLPGLRLLGYLSNLWLKRPVPKLIVNIHSSLEEITLYSGSFWKEVVSRVHWAIALRMMRRVDRLVVNSAYAESFMKHLGVSKSRIVKIPNGLPDNIFPEYGIDKPSKVVLCVGRFFPVKGQDLMIRAFAKSSVRKTHELVFIGSGDPHFEKYCRELALSLGIANRVVFMGAQPHVEVLSYLRKAEICAFPSRLESFGIAVLESMAFGKPTIATVFGGTKDFVTSGQDGILVNPLDIDSFAGYLDQLDASPSLREKIGKNALTKARTLSWSNVVMEYVRLYHDLVPAWDTELR